VRELQRAFRPSVVLVHVDVDDPVAALGDVTATALRSDCTLICAWSHQARLGARPGAPGDAHVQKPPGAHLGRARRREQEAARYIETYKMYENKPPDAIQGRTEPDYLSRLTAALTTVRGVNRTDVLTLGAALRTMSAVMQARRAGHPGPAGTPTSRRVLSPRSAYMLAPSPQAHAPAGCAGPLRGARAWPARRQRAPAPARRRPRVRSGAADGAAGAAQASAEELSACAGIGPTKVRRLHDTFHEPFRKQLHAPGAAPGAAAACAPRPASARGASPSSVDEEEAEAVAAAAHADAGPALHMPLEEDEGEAADEDEPDVDTGQVGYER